MKLMVIRTGAHLAPLGDPVGQAQVGLGTLAEHQQGLAARFGLSFASGDSPDDVASDEPLLLLMEHTFLSPRLVRFLLSSVRQARDVVRVALPRSRLVELYGQLQDLPTRDDGAVAYDAWWFPVGVARGQARTQMAGARWHLVPFKERILDIPVPRNIVGSPVWRHPLTTTVAMHIRHWVHVLWLGNLWPQITLVDRITSQPLGTAARLLASIRMTLRASRWAAAARFSYLAPDVDIHPTARVELSVLGRGCRVGPFALVRGSVLGAGVHVEERANVCYSTLADGCFVSKNSTVVSCVGYPQADLCINGMQFCLAGKGAALTSLVRPMDMRFREPVTVMHEGASVPIRELMVGVCFGHGCFVGPDVLIAPGREIPNASVVGPAPGAILARVDPAAAAGGPAEVRDGVLVPRGALGRTPPHM